MKKVKFTTRGLDRITFVPKAKVVYEDGSTEDFDLTDAAQAKLFDELASNVPKPVVEVSRLFDELASNVPKSVVEVSRTWSKRE